MRAKGIVNVVGITALALLAALMPVSAAAEDSETLLEQAKALEAEQNPVLRGDFPAQFIDGAPYPLFIGSDDTAGENGFLVDPVTNTFITAFTGAEVWGSAYDPDNDKLYFCDGSTLYEWPIGAGTATMLGTIMDPTGAALSMVGLAFYDTALYGVRNTGEEGVYVIDTSTYVATLFIDYDDAAVDCGGFSADQDTGDLYCTSDDSDTRGLNLINPDGTLTLITAYPAGETDIDGLAIGTDGFAYLCEDEAGDTIHVYDLVGGTYGTPLTSPFTGSEVFSGGAWLYTADGPDVTLDKTVGTVPAVCAATDQITVATNTDVYYCYTATNTGTVPLEIHSLVDDQLGTILDNVAVSLAPAATYEQIEGPVTITAPVINTATWSSYDVPPGYTFDDTVNYSFQDISMTGTDLLLTDDGEADVVIPFPFTFYGVTSTDLCVGNNGGMIFGSTGCSISFSNGALPSSSVPMGILPFWDDIDDETGAVYWETLGIAPTRQLVVQWNMRPHFNGIGEATFQVILLEGSDQILFQYADVDFGDPAFDNGASATVGLNQDASLANQYSFNTPSLSAGLAIMWTPAVSTLVSDVDTAEVLLLDPNIDVNPLSFSSSQMTNTVTMQSLTIGNTGDSNLDWSVVEDNADAVQFYPPFSGLAGSGDASVAEEYTYSEVPKEEVPWSPDSPVWDAPRIVLYDNGPLVTSPGGGSGGADASELQTALGLNVLGFGHQVSAGNRLADDFDVPAGGWFITDITFFAYQTGSSTTSTMTGVNLQIWDGSPDVGGSSVVWGDTTTNVMTTTGWSNIYRTTDTNTSTATNRPIMANAVTVNTFLTPGTYWLDWQTDGSLSSGPWAPPISILGTTTTGNGLQWTGAWAPLIDTGTAGTQQGLPFIIEGDTQVPACVMPDDIPWLGLSTTAGTTIPAGSDMVDLTFDSTGLPVAIYNADLCVYSNDPDPGPGNGTELVIVPVVLDVVIPVELQKFTIE